MNSTIPASIPASPKPAARPPMPGMSAPKPAAKRKGDGAKIAKVVILSAAIASTLSGWGLISATAPEMQQTASLPTETAATQIAQVLPTAAPAATSVATPAATTASTTTTTAATTSAATTSVVTVNTTTQVVARTRASR